MFLLLITFTLTLSIILLLVYSYHSSSRHTLHMGLHISNFTGTTSHIGHIGTGAHYYSYMVDTDLSHLPPSLLPLISFSFPLLFYYLTHGTARTSLLLSLHSHFAMHRLNKRTSRTTKFYSIVDISNRKMFHRGYGHRRKLTARRHRQRRGLPQPRRITRRGTRC